MMTMIVMRVVRRFTVLVDLTLMLIESQAPHHLQKNFSQMTTHLVKRLETAV